MYVELTPLGKFVVGLIRGLLWLVFVASIAAIPIVLALRCSADHPHYNRVSPPAVLPSDPANLATTPGDTLSGMSATYQLLAREHGRGWHDVTLPPGTQMHFDSPADRLLIRCDDGSAQTWTKENGLWHAEGVAEAGPVETTVVAFESVGPTPTWVTYWFVRGPRDWRTPICYGHRPRPASVNPAQHTSSNHPPSPGGQSPSGQQHSPPAAKPQVNKRPYRPSPAPPSPKPSAAGGRGRR